MIPRPLAWGIAIVLTLLEAANVAAGIFVTGYRSDPLVHFTFVTIVGFMLGIREGSTALSRALTVVRNITNQPPATPPAEPPPPAEGSQEPMP